MLGGVRESLVCLALAFRSSLRPGIALRSAGLCLLVFTVWSWVLYRHFQPIGTAAGVVSVFIVMGGAVLACCPAREAVGGASRAWRASPLRWRCCCSMRRCSRSWCWW
ncbi:hypothetical protein GmRootV77_29400 [Variovorax sp. V77]